MASSIKHREPLAEISQVKNTIEDDDNMTVEQFLDNQFQIILSEFKQHTAGLIGKLKQEYTENANSIKEIMNTNITQENSLCVILKCIAGPHIGQRFRLESSGDQGGDSFKMGRSTGKIFREKGVSLYKDKEISTTHAMIELRNGKIFLIDSKSTNGTLLNNEEVAALNPIRLKAGDVITMGSTELLVHISSFEEQENSNKEITSY